MEGAIEKLINDFEDGKLSRRGLAKSLIGLSAGAAVSQLFSSTATAETNALGLTEWQQALLTGVCNQYFSEDATGAIIADATDPDGDGNRREYPFNSQAHYNWLFQRDDNEADACLKSNTRRRVRNAVKRVPNKEGQPWNADPEDESSNILGVFANMDDLGVTKDQTYSMRQYIYELMGVKIDRAYVHGEKHGMRDISKYIHDNTNEDCKIEVLRWGSRLYFGVDDDSKIDEFGDLLTDGGGDSHEW